MTKTLKSIFVFGAANSFRDIVVNVLIVACYTLNYDWVNASSLEMTREYAHLKDPGPNHFA